MKRSEANKLIAEYKERYFDDLKGSRCILEFGGHRVEGIAIADVVLAKTTGMKNTPDKRIRDTKQYTPMLMEIITNEGSLLFVIEDTSIATILNGIRLTIGENKVEIRKS